MATTLPWGTGQEGSQPSAGTGTIDTLWGHHSSHQCKEQGSVLPTSPITGRCLLSRATSQQPAVWSSSLTNASDPAPLPSTAGSSFLLPSSNRKLPLCSQGCKHLTLRAASIPHQAQPSFTPAGTAAAHMHHGHPLPCSPSLVALHPLLSGSEPALPHAPTPPQAWTEPPALPVSTEILLFS